MRNLLLPLFLLLLASCSSDRLEYPESGESFVFSGVMEGEESDAATRAQGTSSFSEGDEIGIYVVKRSGNAVGALLSSSNFADNKRYVYRSGRFQPYGERDKIYPPVGEAVDFYAYYPYRSSHNPLSWIVSTNPSSSTLRPSNYLVARSLVGATHSKAVVPFRFLRQTSDLRVVIKKNPYFQPSKVWVRNMMLTQTVNIRTDARSLSSQSTDRAPLFLLEETSDAYHYGLLLPPGNQLVANAEHFRIQLTDGTEKAYSHPGSITMVRGQRHTYTLSFAAQPTTERTFTVSPSTIRANSPAGARSLSITSQKTQKLNGQTLSQTNLAYRVVSKPDWLTLSGVSLSWAVNESETERTGVLVLEQSESGVRKTVTVIQSPKIKIETEI